MVKGLPFEVVLPDNIITRAEAKKAFHDLREQASDIPEMSLDEINAVKQYGVEVFPQSTGEILVDMDDLIFYEVVMEKREDDSYLVTGNHRQIYEGVCGFGRRFL